VHPLAVASADDFPPIELPRASDAVSRALVDGIRAGLAPVGSKLPKDSELARAFGVSRAGVREAFELLRQAGIVEMRRGHLGGVFVRSLVIPTELLTDRTSLVLEEVRQLLEARRAVETTCAALATTRASDAEVDALAELADGLLDAHDRPEDFIELDVRFHLRLASASGNEPLAEFLATIFRRLAAVRARYPVAYGSMATAEQYQQSTVEALRLRDPELMARRMHEHLAGLEEHFLGETLGPADA
jgi:GntR family transcriptional regulator, transcriptional repressor for pyruvate dehydrogenase complex